MLYFSTDNCINKSLTYLLTYYPKTVLVGLEPATCESLVRDLTTTPPRHERQEHSIQEAQLLL